MLITVIARLIAALNANRRPGEVAAAIATGLWLALLPAGNLLWVALLFAAAMVRLNLGMLLVATGLLTPLAPLADPLLHRVGAGILTNPALVELFTRLYRLPLVPLTRFNNTVVFGALIAGAILWIPAFFLGRVLVQLYRRSIHPRIANSKLVQAFERIPIVSKIGGLVRKFSGVYSAVA